MTTTGVTRLAVEQVLRSGAAVPDGMQLGRCHGRSHEIGVAWPAGVATLDEMTCPLCGGTLAMTTRRLRRPFYVIGRAATREQARRARAAAASAVQTNIAAGRSKLARTLEAGDVLHPDVTRRGHPVQVVEAGLPGRYKSHVGLLVQTPLEELRKRGRTDREDELARWPLSLPARGEVQLAGDLAASCTWPASAAKVRVAVAERELAFAERMLAGAKERLAEEGDEGYRAAAVADWISQVTSCQAELDAAIAAAAVSPEATHAEQKRNSL
jgi:hypothetical protein